MNNFIVHLLNNASYISAILFIAIGILSVTAVLSYIIIRLLDFIYLNVKASKYFIQFVRHRKKFIEWYKENK